jgi:hypothetical protein
MRIGKDVSSNIFLKNITTVKVPRNIIVLAKTFNLRSGDYYLRVVTVLIPRGEENPNMCGCTSLLM